VFSWKKPDPKPEEAAVEELAQLLNRMFSGKLGRLEANLSGVPRELEALKADFNKACSDFEMLDAEPDVENMWNPNISAIKSQKASYSAALRNIIAKLRTGPADAPNAYVGYKLLFMNIEDSLNAVLRYNSNFKTVLYRYPSYLKDFKRVFSSVEAVCNRIKAELDRKEEDYNAYNSISDEISKLSMSVEEINALRDGIRALEASRDVQNQEELDIAEEEAAGKAAAKRLEISAAAEQLSGITGRIGMLTAPLEKASRKFDHLSGKKAKLGAFLDDPVSMIRSEEDYRSFMALLKELGAAVETGSVDVKNKPEIRDALSRLVNSDIYYDIESLDSARKRIRELESEWRELDRVSGSIKAGREGREQAARQIESMNQEIGRIMETQERLKASIEKRFLASYSKHISIRIG